MKTVLYQRRYLLSIITSVANSASSSQPLCKAGICNQSSNPASTTQTKNADSTTQLSSQDPSKVTTTFKNTFISPVHVLLVGKIGLGNFLEAIEKAYPQLSYFALASGSTGAGLINACFNNPARFLLIDELEDLRASDQANLLSLLQDGVLVETKVSKTRRIEFTCSVFGLDSGIFLPISRYHILSITKT
jgi:hypothetical protein